MNSIRRDKTATDPEGNGSTLTKDNLDPALGVPLLVRQNHAGNYANSSAYSNCTDAKTLQRDQCGWIPEALGREIRRSLQMSWDGREPR